MTTSLETDICIVGAGPVGATLACGLAARGVRVAIIDRAPLPPMEHPDFDGRAYAIAAGSRAMLDAAGVWDRLPFPAGPIRDIRVSDGRVGRPASPLSLHFSNRDIDADASGWIDADAFGWMVEARSLRVALNARLNQGDLTLRAPVSAEVMRDADRASIALSTGETLTARLVVATEGRDSPLRRQAGIPVTRLPYGQSGIVCAISHERPHHGIALEHFLPGGPFAQLPMAPSPAADNLSAIVWTERAALAERMFGLDDATFAREVSRRLGSHLGAIKPVGRRWIYKLSAMHAHRYTDTRMVLAGDAAHGIHPIAGQGLNLGFRDVAALLRLITDAVTAGEDPGAPALLARYQRERRPDNLVMLAATDALDRLFSTDRRVVRMVRDLGIAGVDRMPRLKRGFIRVAMGR